MDRPIPLNRRRAAEYGSCMAKNKAVKKTPQPFSITLMGDGSYRVRGMSGNPSVSMTKMQDWNRDQDQNGYFYRTFNPQVAGAFASAHRLTIQQSRLS